MRTAKILTPFIGVFLLVTPAFAQTDVSAQITALLAQIKALQGLILQLQAEAGISTTCVDLSYNHYLGRRDGETRGEVSTLQRFLQGTGDYTYPEITGYYGPATQSAVQRWQASNDVVSSGNPETTGYGVVGPQTRSAMSCGDTSPIGRPSIVVEVEEEGIRITYKNLPLAILQFIRSNSKEIVGAEDVSGSGTEFVDNGDLYRGQSDLQALSRGNYYLKIISKENGREIAFSNEFYLPGKDVDVTAFSATPTFGTAPLGVLFKYTMNPTGSCNGGSQSIDFGDGSAQELNWPADRCGSYVQYTSYKYSQPGTYIARLYVPIHDCGIVGLPCPEEEIGRVKITVVTEEPVEVVDLKVAGLDGPITIQPNTVGMISWKTSEVSGCTIRASSVSGTKIETIEKSLESGAFDMRIEEATTFYLDCKSGNRQLTDKVVVNTTPQAFGPTCTYASNSTLRTDDIRVDSTMTFSKCLNSCTIVRNEKYGLSDRGICTYADRLGNLQRSKINPGNTSEITVTAPNGGEQFDPSKSMIIQFSSEGLSSASLALYKNDQWKYWINKSVQPSAKDLGFVSFEWVPSVALLGLGEGDNAGSIFKIYATGQKADGTGYVDDKSDNPFGFVSVPTELEATIIPLISGTSWAVPSDWNSANNTIEVIGAGGGGGNNAGGGGGGGAYSKINNLSLTPGATITYSVGTGGGTKGDGSDTWFNGTSLAASSVGAKGGSGGRNSGSAGGGGSSASGVGTTKYSGGNGGVGPSANNDGGGGGGGAAGPSGAGKNGGQGKSDGSGGGGGAGGGASSAGANASGDTGGNGGNGPNGTGGGARGTSGVAGEDGANGGGGGGGTDGRGSIAKQGGAGGNGTEWGSYGAGGGAGGASKNPNGASGGLYGGGGSASGENASVGGTGGQGIVVITYAPVVGGNSASASTNQNQYAAVVTAYEKLLNDFALFLKGQGAN